MTATSFRLITIVLALTLLLSGCMLGRTSRTTTVAPREQASPSTLNVEVETLRQQNAQLRREQETLQTRIDELQRTLAQNQEDQRRFRESMTTNFDLLEQSVALTLSKTITADMSRSTAASGAAPQSASQGITHAMPATAAGKPGTMPIMGPQPEPQRAAQPSAAPGPAPTAMTSGAPGHSAAMAAPVAMRGDTDKPMDNVSDPDLLPPAAPRQLSAHGEAKPLYEKGFALFARKDYDQAVIVFRNFLTRFPDDIYSDNAQFWIGEAYLNMNRDREAESAYRQVLRDYEHRSTLEGYKTPDAIYRLGQIHQQRGQLERTRLYFSALGERFPDTSAGRKAVRELTTLGINTAAR